MSVPQIMGLKTKKVSNSNTSASVYCWFSNCLGDSAKWGGILGLPDESQNPEKVLYACVQAHERVLGLICPQVTVVLNII